MYLQRACVFQIMVGAKILRRLYLNIVPLPQMLIYISHFSLGKNGIQIYNIKALIHTKRKFRIIFSS